MRFISKGLRAIALLTLLSSIGPGILAASGQRSADDVWTSISVDQLETSRAAGATPWIRPDWFSAFELEPSALNATLAAAPMEFTFQAMELPAVLALPRPDGRFERFAVVESPVMHPDLEEKMADEGWPMKTYSGTSLDSPANVVRFDWGGPAGFHAMVHSPDGDFFIDPYWQGDMRLYTSYYKRDYTRQGKGRSFQCNVESATGATFPHQPEIADRTAASVTTGGLLRTYRMAMAGTGEYTAFHGGTKAAGQAAITTTVNRVNMVYERDFSLRMTLVANNIDLIYTDGGTDPYSNGNCGAMLGENQTNIDLVIMSANYDIGHVSGTGSGGVASLQSPCSASKARGCTGRDMPVGDPFDIDFVAHEVGHQWGGNHTWAGSGGSCSAGAFEPTAAYEPGSGSTIQAYAGICGTENLQANSDDHFHRKSLDEMGAFINGAGSCSSTGDIVNPTEPTANAGSDYTIPMGTPFELTGSGSDADGDPLTFNWEQFDLAPEQELLSVGDDGDGPIFRSWPSSTSPTRVFPRLQDLVGGTLSPGEVLPATDRSINFRLTVRDNRPGGGREADDAMTVTSTTTAGPFQVTAPNGGENFAAGSSQTVTWNVANTTAAPVSAANVDILLSSDGGMTYPTVLVSNTPNDGSEVVTLPANISTAGGRVKIKGAGNIFFDISDDSFLVNGLSQCRTPALALADPGSVSDQMTVVGAQTLADLNVKLDVGHTWLGDVSVTLEHVDTATSVTLIDRPGVPASPQGCSNDDIQADLDDEAAAPVEDQCSDPPPAISGVFMPNSPLSAFDGEAVAGTWKLTVNDALGGDTGTLNMWCLGGSYVVAGCPADLVLANQTLLGAQTHEATSTATLGPALIVDGTNVVVNAPTVMFLSGVEVRGTFQAGNATSCP